MAHTHLQDKQIKCIGTFVFRHAEPETPANADVLRSAQLGDGNLGTKGCSRRVCLKQATTLAFVLK